MNVLIVNTLYYPQGGAPQYGLMLAKLLSGAGHNPIPFAMKTPHDLPTPYAKYFVSFIDFKEELRKRSPKSFFKVLSRIFHFSEAAEKIDSLLADVQVDIVHLNNFLHHISLSIIEPIKKRRIPIVWSLHDHILVCPNTNLYNDKLGKPCDLCRNFIKRLVLPPVKRCKKGSFGASLMASLEALYIATKKPALIPKFFIAPSHFLVRKHAEMGFDTTRFVVVPNPVDTKFFTPHPEPGNYALYFGRLSAEKGLEHMIKAFAMLGKYELVIAGDGPMRAELEKLAETLAAPVRFVGRLVGEKLRELIYRSRMVILPSVCFENAPLMVLEGMASAKPILASNIGGIPELVTDDVGILFEPGRAEGIADAVAKLWNDERKLITMGNNARRRVEENHSPEVHLVKILELYSMAAGGNG